MTRFLLHSRRILAVGVFLLLAVVLSLSTATRRPCLHVCSGPWRLWKAGHMTKPESRAIGNHRIKVEAVPPQVAVAAVPDSYPWRSVQVGKPIRPATSVLRRFLHFRSPPRPA